MERNRHGIQELIRQGESLMLEFKSDLKCLPDRNLVAAVVSLANTDGGELLLGVEDNGAVTGLHPNHINVSGIPALIANKTNPAIAVMVVEQEDRLGNMPIDSLIILSRLRDERRLTTADLAPSVQKPEASVRSSLEKLVETGFLEPHGAGRGRIYTLSARLYQKADQRAEYIRQVGFAPIQQEQMVLNYIDKNGSIKRAEVMDLCHLDRNQAYRLLVKMKQAGRIKQIGEHKGATYERA